jgi:plastocyanin
VQQRRQTGLTALIIALALCAASCGSSTPASPTPSPSPSPTPVSTPTPGPSPGPSDATITIGANGVVSPKVLTVSAGTRVTFVNNDARAHDMSSDPHPDHTDCPEINQAGFLTPGQSRQTGNLNTRRTCGFHDHILFTNTNLMGQIVIQ